MKKLQKPCAAIALALALALSALAGEIPTPGATNPPPPQQSSVTGEMDYPSVTSTSETSAPSVDPMTEIMLSLLESVLPIF